MGGRGRGRCKKCSPEERVLLAPGTVTEPGPFSWNRLKLLVEREQRRDTTTAAGIFFFYLRYGAGELESTPTSCQEPTRFLYLSQWPRSGYDYAGLRPG